MARPIAGINDYPYGECGFIVDGALLKNGVKLKDLRIYKQRSIHTFDLIDPRTETIYQKVQITGFDTGYHVLDYDMSDDELLNVIPINSFFVRGYDSTVTQRGFVIRFLYNKVVLSDGSQAYLFDMYTPECSIPMPDLGTIIVNTVTVNSTTVTGSISALSGSLNENGMIVTLTTPNGRVYTTTVINRAFTFSAVQFDGVEGTGTITVTSPYYNTATIPFTVEPADTDSDYVTVYPVAASQFVSNGDGTYSYTLPASTHQRGADLVVQIQDPNGLIHISSVSVDSTGNVTVTQMVQEDIDILLIGDTEQDGIYATPLIWTLSGSEYEMVIPASTHMKQNVAVSVYEGTELVTTTVQIDSSENVTLISETQFTGKVVIAGKS